MRTAALTIGLAALACIAAEPATAAPKAPTAVSHDLRTNVVARTAPPGSVAADIAAIEQRWGEAFLKGDRAFLEKLVAPEFKLMRAEGGTAEFTPRERWLANYDRYVFHEFEVRTLDVVAAGDTAVATVQGRWKVSRRGQPGTRNEGFIVSDTFVRRGNAWQVIYRHSTPHPLPQPQAEARQQRGR